MNDDTRLVRIIAALDRHKYHPDIYEDLANDE